MNEQDAIILRIPGNMMGGSIGVGIFYLIEYLVAYKDYDINLLDGYEIVGYIPGLRERGYAFNKSIDDDHNLASTIDGYELVIRKK